MAYSPARPGPNHRWRGEVTPARRGKCIQSISNTEVRTPAESHAAMTWAQRLKRVFNIDIEVCGRCGGTVRVIACIEDQDVIDSILAHLRNTELETPSLPLLPPPSRAPPEICPIKRGRLSPLFAGQGPPYHHSISRDATEHSVGMGSCGLPHENDHKGFASGPMQARFQHT